MVNVPLCCLLKPKDKQGQEGWVLIGHLGPRVTIVWDISFVRSYFLTFVYEIVFIRF